MNKSKLWASLTVLGAITVGSVGYGVYVGGQNVPIWLKDASNVVQLQPRTLAINTASSTNFTVGTTTLNNCVTTTWNPGSMGSSTPAAANTSTDIAFPGATTADICLASLTSATTTGATVKCLFTGTATATVYLANISGAALDLATGTARACRFH